MQRFEYARLYLDGTMQMWISVAPLQVFTGVAGSIWLCFTETFGDRMPFGFWRSGSEGKSEISIEL